MATFYYGLDCQWRQEILTLLQNRNRNQNHSFRDLIALHNRLFENVDILRAQNLQLTVQVEKLRDENLQLHLKSDSSGSTNEKTLAQEHKLFRLQEELTELHRKRGEHTQQLIDLRNLVQEKDKELTEKEYKLKESESLVKNILENQKKLEQTIKELELTNQIIKDEHQALQLAYSSLEKKYRDLHDEHHQLVDRWLSQKAHDADRLNDENDLVVREPNFHRLPAEVSRKFSGVRNFLTASFNRKHQEKLRKELAEAAKEPLSFPEKCFPEPNYGGKTSLPRGVLTKYDAHESEVNAIKWGPSGNFVATGGADRKVKLWEIVKGLHELRGTFSGSNAAITSLDFDSEGTFILGASNDFASRVWSIVDQRVRHVLTGHSAKVLAAKFLGNSTKVVSGSHDRTLKIWDLRSHACIRTIFAMSTCFDVVTDQPGTVIISGHFDKRIRFWDSRSETSANEVQLQGKVTSLDISRDNNKLLSCTRDDTLKVLDLRMNQVIGTYSADGFKVGTDSTRAVFSPDGQYVCCGSQDGGIFIWNTLDGKLEKTLKEHNNVVNACSWQISGSHLATCDKSHKIVIWTDI